MDEVSKLRIPGMWAKLIRRLMGLTRGRYQITLTVEPSGVDWTVLALGAIER